MTGERVRVVLATGGTGGHVFPAEALAAQLRERGIEPVLFTDRRGNAFGDEVAVRRIRGGAIAGQTPWGRIKSVAELAAGWVQAAWGLRRVSPRAVVGFGGYASVPTVLAAAATATTNDHPRAECRSWPRQPVARQARRADRDRFRHRCRPAARGRAQAGANRHAGAPVLRPVAGQ